MSDVVALCYACADTLRIEEELTISTSSDVCCYCRCPVVSVAREPGLPWKLAAALWSSTVQRAHEARLRRIESRAHVPPPPQERAWPAGEKEPGREGR